MLNLWYTHTIGDEDQEFLKHRQVRKAAEAISNLHYPHYPTVETFASWSEIQSALDAATAEPQVFIYILAFGALNAKKAGEVRVHIRVPPPSAPEEEAEPRGHGHDDEDAPDSRSYYSPKMPRFTEIYFRCLVDAVTSKDDFGTLVNRGLEGAYVAAVQLRLRYQPEAMQLLLRPSPDSTVRAAGIALLNVSDDVKRGICRGYASLPTPSQPDEDAQPGTESTTVGGRQAVTIAAAPAVQHPRDLGPQPVSATPSDWKLSLETVQAADDPCTQPTVSVPQAPSTGREHVPEHSESLASAGSQSPMQLASKELARRFTPGPKGMVLHVGPFASPSVDNGRKVCPVCTMTIPDEVTWTDHVLTERHLQAVGDPLPHAQYYCYICRAVISGDKNLILHVEGTRHRRKVEIGKRCGIDGCEMLVFADADMVTHRAVCHPLRSAPTTTADVPTPEHSGESGAPSTAPPRMRVHNPYFPVVPLSCPSPDETNDDDAPHTAPAGVGDAPLEDV